MAQWRLTQKVIRKLTEKILNGSLLALDPSSAGGKSKPGWALYQGGQLVQSGTLQVSASWDLHQRLYGICSSLRNDFDPPDVFVIEEIRQVPGFFGHSVEQLLKGVGAIMAGVNCDNCIEIPPRLWKAKVDSLYVKSDEADAIYLGKFVIQTAKNLATAEGEKKLEFFAPRKAPSNRKADLKWEKKTKRKSSTTSPKNSGRVQSRKKPSKR